MLWRFFIHYTAFLVLSHTHLRFRFIFIFMFAWLFHVDLKCLSQLKIDAVTIHIMNRSSIFLFYFILSEPVTDAAYAICIYIFLMAVFTQTELYFFACGKLHAMVIAVLLHLTLLNTILCRDQIAQSVRDGFVKTRNKNCDAYLNDVCGCERNWSDAMQSNLWSLEASFQNHEQKLTSWCFHTRRRKTIRSHFNA